MTVSTLTIICDILAKHMDLCCDQIWIYNQKRNIPTDSRLYVVVGFGGADIFASIKKHKGGTSLSSELSQYTQETIEVNLLSANTDAIERAYEVIGALTSDYAQAAQESNGMRIATKPARIQDTSAAEVTRQLFRTTIEFKVLRAYTQNKSVAYYEEFNERTVTEQGEV
jgi:hypothetical protein